MPVVTLKLEGACGDEIKDVIADAVGVAKRCGCWTEVNVNGIVVMAHPADDPVRLFQAYGVAQARNLSYASVT